MLTAVLPYLSATGALRKAAQLAPSPDPRHEAQGTGNGDGEQCLQVMLHNDVSNPFQKSRRRPPRRCTPALIRIRQLDTIECVSVYGLRASEP